MRGNEGKRACARVAWEGGLDIPYHRRGQTFRIIGGVRHSIPDIPYGVATSSRLLKMIGLFCRT